MPVITAGKYYRFQSLTVVLFRIFHLQPALHLIFGVNFLFFSTYKCNNIIILIIISISFIIINIIILITEETVES